MGSASEYFQTPYLYGGESQLIQKVIRENSGTEIAQMLIAKIQDLRRIDSELNTLKGRVEQSDGCSSEERERYARLLRELIKVDGVISCEMDSWRATPVSDR
jgi:hypothetical protein